MYFYNYIRLWRAKKAPRLESMATKKLMRLSYVYDGDTIIVYIIDNGNVVLRRCRLYGFDSPELSNKETKQEALEAKHFLETLIPKRPFLVEVKGHDKYGRLLINPKNKNTYISKLMIDNGHGVEYYGGKKK